MGRMKKNFPLFLQSLILIFLFLTVYSFSHAEDLIQCNPVLNLENAIQRTLNHSHKLKIVEALIQSRSANIQQSSLYPNPEFSFEVVQFGGSREWKGWKNREIQYGITQLIELGGKRSARINLATYEYYSALIDYELVKLQSINALTKTFIDVASKQELYKLAQEQTKASQEFLNMVQEQVEAGKSSFIQETKGAIALANAEMREEKALLDFMSAKTRLGLFWGSACSDFDSVSYSLDTIQPPPPLNALLEDVDSHPIISKMNMNYLAAEEGVRLEKAGRIPDVAVTLGYEDDHWSKSKGLIFGLSLPLPICNQNQGNIARAYSDVTKVENEKEAARLLLRTKISNYYYNLVRAYKEADKTSNRLLKSVADACSCTLDGYQEGKFSYSDVLEAYQILFDIKAQYILTLRDYHSIKIDLDYLDGQNE